jgi:hypothetical protein
MRAFPPISLDKSDHTVAISEPLPIAGDAPMRWSQLSLLISIIAWAFPFDAKADNPTLRWEIDNRFRYFQNASDFRAIAAVYDSLKTSQNPKPTVLQLEQTLERSVIQGAFNGMHGSDTLDGWAASIFLKTCGQEIDHRYATCKMQNGDAYLSPTSANVILALDGADTSSCEWRVDNTIIATQPCGQSVTASKISYAASHTVQVTPSGGTSLSAQIQLKDVLIVSLGDSFSAGEGNPEKPVRLVRDSYNTYIDSSRGQAFPVREDLNVAQASQSGRDHFFQDLAPVWSNSQCHRSLYSHHTRAALQYALEHPHLSVTLLNYSCAGAEVYEGILNAWWGRDDVAPGDYDDAPQLVKTLRDLCKEPQPYEKIEWAQNRDDALYNNRAASIAKCNSFVRAPDVILLSIGGNDVGFARMIANAAVDVPTTGSLARGRSWVYGLWRAVAGPETYSQGLALARVLIPQRYEALDGALQSYLGVSGNKIILSAYPQIIYNQDGKICKPGNLGMDVHAIFGINDPHTPSQSASFVDAFYTIMSNAAAPRHWLLADQHLVQDKAPNNFKNDAVGMGHGLCATGPDYSAEGVMQFPRPTPHTVPPMKWNPTQPQSYRPYSPRTRWFVTPNDSFLTTNYHDASMQYIYDEVQPVYAATLSGSFHPNALGQAAIADSVLIKLRESLNRFED